MKRMGELLSEGGKCIYVAPAGGRDRKGADGALTIAPFDEGSIEMFYLMARKAKKPTHFIPLTLATYDLLPPPETIQRELGELRLAHRTPIHMALAPPFDMEHFPGATLADKDQRRAARAQAIWSIVNTHYQRMP